jgi:alkylation response protein AidB-like acyl-CoA dehydrogenase
VHLEEPDELMALREELRRYFAELLTDEVRAALRDPSRAPATTRDLVRRMGADGWLAVGWPSEYGGGGRGPKAQLVFFDEVLRAGAPYPLVTVNTVGPGLMRHGTDEQKARFLPGIARGEIHFAIGYTEPQAGTDLASLRTRAERDGDQYVVHGNKVFTSGIDVADWVWLACRTDPSVPKHEGISILLVDVRSEGFSWTPIETVGGVTTSATYYDGVRVPVTDRVGPEGGGWRIMTTQLNHERVTLGANSGLAYELVEGVRTWAASTPVVAAASAGNPTGERRVLDEPWVQQDLARAHARLEAVRLLNWRMAAAMEAGDPAPGDSSLVKVFATESLIEVYRLLLGIVGPQGHLPVGSPGAVLAGRLERAGRQAQINTFGGGVNEVQRELLAARALHVGRRAGRAQSAGRAPSAGAAR